MDALTDAWNFFMSLPPVVSLLIGLLGAFLLFKLIQTRSRTLPPGPYALPILGNWLRFKEGLNPINLAQLARDYGDVVLIRMGLRNVLVISSPEMAKEVLQTQGVEFGSRPRNLVFDVISGKGQDIVNADYGEHWRKMRRIATVPFFTSKVIQQNREAWEREVDLAIADIQNLPNVTTVGAAVRDRLQFMLYNIVYRMLFGSRFTSLNDPLYLQLMTLNHDILSSVQSLKYSYADFLPFLEPFVKGYLKGLGEANQRRLVFLRDEFLNKRKQSNGEGEKIGVDYVIEAQQRGEINETSVLYLLQNMNVAAIETTLSAMDWGIGELVNNQDIQKKLRTELDSVLGRNVPVTEPDIARLPYLQALVKEVLRKHMVVPLLLPHMNPRPAKLGGYDIPAGCRIIVNAWGIGNDPRYWENPDDFRPERFLESKMEVNGSDMRFIPFGAGRRSCPGSIIAWPVLSVTLGRMVQACEVFAPPGVERINPRNFGGQQSLGVVLETSVVVKRRSS